MPLKLAVSEQLDQSVADCFGAWQLDLHSHAAKIRSCLSSLSLIYWRMPLNAVGITATTQLPALRRRRPLSLLKTLLPSAVACQRIVADIRLRVAKSVVEALDPIASH